MKPATKKKEPKFGAAKQNGEKAKAPFYIDIAPRLTQRIKLEHEAANKDLETYTAQRQSDLNRLVNTLLEAVTLSVDIPEGVVLVSNADYTKLVEK